MEWFTLPRAMQFVIDDVGWWRGRDDHDKNGPYRTNICRDHCINDYVALIELGKRLKMRPLCAFILCEWDKDNILRQCPTSQWMGENWVNDIPAELMEEAADLLNANSDHIEIGLHGVGHEYWHPETGKGERAEFADNNGNMRPEEEIRKHLEYFGKLMDMHNLGPFPVSMFPPAARYRYSPNKKGLGYILSQYGIKYLTLPINITWTDAPMLAPTFSVEHNILIIDRHIDMYDYNVIGPTDQMKQLYKLTNTVIGMHWPNVLHQDPERNLEIVDKWVEAVKTLENDFGTCLAEDSAHAFSQEPYRWGTAIWIEGGNRLVFDFKRVDALKSKSSGILNEFYFKTKVKLQEGMHNGIMVSPPAIQGDRPFYLYKLKRIEEGSCRASVDLPKMDDVSPLI